MAKENKQNSPYSELSRKLKGSDYGSAIDTLQTDLELLEASGAEMEALLIYMVNRCYRQRSFNVDITLMALGLLDGYNNRLDRLEPIEERDLYSERRERFLQNTNYIATKYRNLAKTFKEAEQTLVKNQKSGEEFPLIERIRKTLDRSTTNLLIAVLKKLYDEKASVNVYLDKAKKDFQKRADEKELGNIDWSEDHIFPQLLPSLKYYRRPPEETSLSQPCDTVKNLNFIDKKNPVEVARVIALTSTGPVESDSEPPAEQVQNLQLGFVPEPSASTHRRNSEPTTGHTLKPSIEPTHESTLGLFPESAQGQLVGTVPESAPALAAELPSCSTQEPTQESPLKSTLETPPDTILKSDSKSVSGSSAKSYTDALGNDEISPLQTNETETPETTGTSKNPSNRLSIFSKYKNLAVIERLQKFLYKLSRCYQNLTCLHKIICSFAMIAVVACAIFIINKYTNDKDINQVEANEGGGTNETSTESNFSMTYQSPSGAKVNINISGTIEAANVSVDPETGEIRVSLNEYFYGIAQDAAIKDFSAEEEGHEDGN